MNNGIIMKPEQLLLDLPPSLTYDDSGHNCDLLDRLNSLRKNGQFCDVVLQIGRNELPAHRAVLASASGYLMELFSRLDSEGWDGQVKLNSFTYDEFQVLLEYIYTGRLEVEADKVKAVYRTSRLLKMPRAAEACVNFMTAHLNPENCVGTRACGSGHNDSALTAVCDEYIAKNVEEVTSSKDCLALPRVQVEIVGTDDITINPSNEDSLFNLVLGWVRLNIESEDCEEDITSDHVHVLFLGTDNVLHDCKDLDNLALDNAEYIKDYKQLSKKRQTPAKGRKEGKNGVNGDVAAQRNFNFVPIENESIEKEWKVIVSEKTGEHQYMCICVLEDRLVTVSVHLRQRPSSVASGDGSENGSVSPRPVRKSGPGKSGSSSPTHVDRQMSLIPLARMTSSRSGLGSALLDGKIVAVGGYERGECLSSVEQYDVRTNRWTPLAPMRNPRGRFDATISDGRLYACGGSNGMTELRSAEYYDAEEDKWMMLPDMNKPRASPGTAAWRGRLYCIGGSNGQGGMKSCEMYDPEKNAWTESASLSNRRSEAGVCVLQDIIYSVGGCDSWNCLNTVEVYDPAEDKWDCVSSMNSCRRGAGVVAFMGKVWVIGGSDGQSSLNSVEVYDPEQNAWSSGPLITTPRVSLSATVVEGRIYILGGFSGKAFLDTIEYFDYDAYEWCTYVPGSSDTLMLPVMAKLNGVH